MDFIKKQGISFYIMVVAAILSIVAVSVYGSEVGMTYYVKENVQVSGLIVTFSILAILIAIAEVVVPQFKFSENAIVKIALDVLMVAFVVLTMITGMVLLQDRVYYLAITLGSDLNAGDAGAFDAAYKSIAVFVLYMVTVVVGIVGTFFSVQKR